MKHHKPTAGELEAAAGKLLPDLLGPEMKGIFCGINPSLYSAARGLHFARPGNRFWPALYAGGITNTLLQPHEQPKLLEQGWGISNVAERPTTAAAELSLQEVKKGAKALEEKVLQYQPVVLAILGLTVYRSAFGVKEATVGLQPEMIGSTSIWVLPNPSGLNAHYTPKRLGELFADLRSFVERAS